MDIDDGCSNLKKNQLLSFVTSVMFDIEKKFGLKYLTKSPLLLLTSLKIKFS